MLTNVMFQVLQANNDVPVSPDGISNITGSLTPIGVDTFQMNTSQMVSFDVSFMSTNSFDHLFISSNASSVLLNAVINSSNGNPATLSLSWSSPKHGGTYTFTVAAANDQCIVGIGSRNFTLIVGNGINSVNNISPNFYQLKISPNPVKQEYLTMEYQLINSELVTLVVYDLKGTVLLTKNVPSHTGLNAIRLPANDLSSGKYILRISTTTHTQSAPFIKVE